MSFMAKLQQAKAAIAADVKDPWRLRLQRLTGRIDPDGVERVTTQYVFDVLEIPQRDRTSAAGRRLAG
jgi:hypothetical protein